MSETFNEEAKPSKFERLKSIDALRGMDMIWIIGLAYVVKALDRWLDTPVTHWLRVQMGHAKWDGFTFMDIVMPLFMFITGCSMVFSFSKRLERDGKRKVYTHVLIRVAILWVLGMMVHGKLLDLKWENIKFFSDTLQAIAIGYLGSSLILLCKTLRAQIIWVASLLFTYWALMHFVPVPGHGAGVLTMQGNLAAYVEAEIMGIHDDGRAYTWILSTMTFIVTVMLGCFSGRILSAKETLPQLRLKQLLIYGSALFLGGLLFLLIDPCIKKIWTSSFTLISGGVCILLLALFYWVVDIRKCTWWTYPFIVVGSNSILAYVVFAFNKFFNSQKFMDQFLYGLKPWLGEAYPFVLACAGLGFTCFFLHVMYKKKIFIKI